MISQLFKIALNIFPRSFLIFISYFIKPILMFLYKGTKYEDPIDGRKFRKFLPYGYKKIRKNVLSPSTFSLERHRLLWLYLKNETKLLSENINLLHVAPEQAFYDKFKTLQNINYTTTDMNSPLANVKADICNLPFESNSFDIILCNHVFEHVLDDKAAMEELYRVMKPKGWGVFQVPIDMNLKKTYEDSSITKRKEREKEFGQYDHVRVYGIDYFKRLESVGFKVKKVDYTNKLFKDEIIRFGLVQGELIPVVYKN